MTRTLPGLGALAAMALATVAISAHADITNGGFETGDFSGWAQMGDTSFSGVDAFAARTGSYGAFFGPTSVGGISQSFATVGNTAYLVSFSLSLLDSSQPNSFSWAWNGATQAPSFGNAAVFGYTNFSATVLAIAPTSTIAFSFRSPESFWLLDNVSVVAAPIPEPESAVLFGAGLALMLGALKKRARAHRRETAPCPS